MFIFSYYNSKDKCSRSDRGIALNYYQNFIKKKKIIKKIKQNKRKKYIILYIAD